MVDLQSILASQNPWWKTGRVTFETNPFRRAIFDTLLSELANPDVTVLVGPRRCGKTFLIHQLIEHLLKNGVEKERIIYLQIEGYLKRKNLIAEVMDFVKTVLVREPPSEFRNRVYLFIDEAHKLPAWSEEVKYWNDLKLPNLTIFVTGSSALNMLKGAGESLVGRARHAALLPLSFREFLSAKYGIDIPTGEFREVYAYSISQHLEKIEIAFKDYLHRGGYPSLLHQDIGEAFRNLLEWKDLSLQRDIFELEEVREIKNLNEMVFVLSSLIGNRINYSRIGGMVGLRVHSVKKYIGLLEDIFLLREQMVYSRKPYFSVRKERKICFTDCGMVNALNNNFELPEQFLPFLVENAVSAHVLRKRLEYEINPIHYYWVSDKGREIDVVATVGGETYPVGVKYQNEIEESDMETMRDFMEKFGHNRGIVVTKNSFREEKTENGGGITSMPAWLFLLAF